tara:strand:- start:494 stop:970 length:477 start_codon:yes stop_codon:yes gene_type:complete
MAEINLDILRQPTGDRDVTQIYTDLRLDLKLEFTRNSQLEKENEVRDIVADNNVNAIRNAFISLLTTSPGDKILNPKFGINFGDMLFLPVTEIRADSIGKRIIETVEKFEPRIKLINLFIVPVIEKQEYIVEFVYSIPRFNKERLNLKGTLSRTGFYV